MKWMRCGDGDGENDYILLYQILTPGTRATATTLIHPAPI